MATGTSQETLNGGSEDTERQYYSHLVGEDSRLDEWISLSSFQRSAEPASSFSNLAGGLKAASPEIFPEAIANLEPRTGQKRKRERDSSSVGNSAPSRGNWLILSTLSYDAARPLERLDRGKGQPSHISAA